MHTALSKSIIQNLREVNPFLVEGIEGTETEETLKAVYTLLNLRITRKVQSKEIIKSKKYKKDEAYLLMEVEEDATGKKRILDIRPVKTIETILKIITDIGTILYQTDNNVSISYLYTPNPVQIPEDYWRRYKHTRDPEERKKLATRYELLTDKKILNISSIVLDIDSPFEEVYPVWKELVEKLGLKGYVVFKTKSGRFRAYIKVSGTYNDGTKTFKLTPHGKAKNRRKHIINAYEIQYILASYFEKRGLKYDSSFVGRLNHPVWIEEREVFDEGKSQLYEIKEGEIPFYTLYNRVKKLQREEELWKYKGEDIKNLLKKKEEEIQGTKTSQQTTGTQQTTGAQQTKQQTTQKTTQQTIQKTTQQTTQKTQQTNKQRKIKTKTIKLKKTNEEKLEEAIEVLTEKHKTHRFTRIMLPVVGWGKFLGLDKDTVYHLLRKHLITKKNFDEDFEKAWKYGDPLEFSYGEDLLVRIEKYLNEFVNASEKFRLDLLELFSSEADYYDTERYLLAGGYIEEEFRKRGGRGRPRKVIKITQKGINLIQQWKAGGNLEDLLLNNNSTDNTDPSLENDFTQSNQIILPEGKQSIDILPIYPDNLSHTNGLVDGWKLGLYQGNPSISIYSPDNPLNPSNHLSVNKTTHPVEPPTGQTFKEIPTSLRNYLLEIPSKPTHLSKTSKNNLPVKLTTFDKITIDKLTTFKNHYVKQSFITFIFTDTFTSHLSKNPTSDLNKPTLPSLSLIFTTLSNFEKLTNSKKLSNLSETTTDTDKTIIDGTTYDEKPNSKNLSTFDNLSEPLNPDKKQPKKSKDRKDNKAKKSISKNKEKSNSKKPKKKLNGGGFTKEARIMALLMGYEKGQMGRAVLKISECIDYFYKKTYNLDEAIYKTFAVYIYLSQKSGWKKVFIPAAALPKFEDESLQSEISKAAWGLLERYQKKYNLQQKRQRERQEQKQKQKQKKIL
jgi:hypothetical protein